jgi:hypothetical protein
MKALIVLILISMLNTSIPKKLSPGIPLTKIEKEYPDYHFKFRKKIDKSPFSIAMLGYWKKEGCVLHFNNDTLTLITVFKDFNEYKSYITNPNEKKNIIIKKDNLIL